MNIIYYIIKKFINNNKFNTISITLVSLLINSLKINVISYIVANIISSINNNNEKSTNEYFKYFIVISLLYIIIYIIYKVLQNDILSKLRHESKSDLIDILLDKNNENMSNINFTKLNTPILRISHSIFSFFNNILTQIIPNITLILIMFIYFFYKDIILGTIFLIGNILIIIFIILSYNSILKKNILYEDSMEITDSYIVEILNNIDKIILRGTKNSIKYNLNDYTSDAIYSSNSFYSSAIFHSIFLNLIIFLTIFICIYYLIRSFYKNEISATFFITFITMLLLYRDIILTTIQYIPDVIELIGRCIKVTELYEKSNISSLDTKDYIPISLNYDIIRFENVTFSYKSNDNIKSKIIIKDLNVIIKTNDGIKNSNKIIGITGKSGKGKSTFMKLVIKAYDSYEGNIYIDNINIKELDPTIIRKNIIYVNQNTKLFDDTIRNNIMYGCDDTEKCKFYIKEIMKFNKISELLNSINLNKTAGLGGDRLSGGQRQVINIINGLIMPSKITILDEPTNALDIELKRDIIDLIQYFKKYKKCIIIITHDKDVYKIFDENIEI